MKLTVSRNLLLATLQTCGRVINKNALLPITECFKFDLNKEKLTITATDLENTMISTITVDSEDKHSFCLSSKLFLEFLSELVEQPLNIIIEEKKMIVSAGFGEYVFMTEDAKEFPSTISILDGKKLSLISSKLLRYINTTSFAIANDELRPVMNGIYFDIKLDSVTYVATDAHKLVKLSTKFDTAIDKEDNFILNRKTSSLLCAILPKTEDIVAISFNEKNSMFETDKYTLISRLIEGRYPNYNGVIPQGNSNKLTTDRIGLINAVKRISVFSNSASNIITLDIKNNEIVLQAQDIDFGVSAEEKLPCNYNGEDMKIGFKSNFLIDILKNISTETVNIELSEPTRAGLIMPSENEENEELVCLLMPMILN